MRTLLLLLLSAPAFADGHVQKADDEVTQALLEFRASHFRAAARRFQVAYSLDPRPDLLFSVAQSERLAGRCRAARQSYLAFLETNPAPAKQEAARSARQRCEPNLRPGLVMPEEAEPAPSHPQLVAPAAPPPPAPPTVVVVTQPAPPPPPRRKWYADWVGATLLASGAAVIGVGGTVWGLGNEYVAGVNGARSYDDYVRRLDGLAGAQAEQRVGVSFVAIGGAMVVASVIRYGVVARKRGH
jgi:hypothetical protein